MQKQKTIAIIICYFGKFPWYFEYFLHSCKFNPSVDFFIVTDNITHKDRCPENVKFVYKTLDQINQSATEKLGFEINITQPYKLCDFKPAYGFIFPELIEGYDYWGYGDIDVIFGDIRNFITDDMLSDYDIISVRHDFLTGYFQLLKNNDKMIQLFTNSKDYKKVFSSNLHYCFDETNFEHKAFTDEIPYQLVKSDIESMMHVVCKMEDSNQIKPYFDFHVIEGVPGNLKWMKGKLYYRNKYEIILYHLIKFKSVYKTRNTSDFTFNEFKISPSKIYSFKK